MAMATPAWEQMIRQAWGGQTTSSGVAVSQESAMRLSTVYACVNILSRSVAQLPCHMMRQAGKLKNKAIDFYLYPLLHDQPNPWMTAPEFWGMVMNHLALRGNFYAFKNTGLNPNGKARELLPLAPGRVKEVIQTANYGLFYKILIPNEQNYVSDSGEPTQAQATTEKTFPQSQIFHLRGMTTDGILGMNPIQYVRETIGMGLATQEFGARFFGEGTHPGIIVEHPGVLKDPSKMREALTATYSGLGKSHRIMLLEEGMKAQRIVIDPKDSQFIDTRKFNKSEIVDIFFGMPLTLFHSGEATPTYASAEEFSVNFVVYALMPWLVNIEKAIWRDLIQPEDRKEYYAKFSAGALLRGTMQEQATYFQQMVNAEIMNPNECRDLIDLNPYEGGDEYRSRTSTVKQEETETEKEKVTKTKTKKTEEEEG